MESHHLVKLRKQMLSIRLSMAMRTLRLRPHQDLKIKRHLVYKITWPYLCQGSIFLSQNSHQDESINIVYSTNRLAARLQSGREDTITFDKDDDDTLDFVTAAANLRSAAYGIERKTRWEVKGVDDMCIFLHRPFLIRVRMGRDGR